MQTLNLKLRGLHTHPNPLSEVPEGALLKAKNMVMDKEGVIETRRGFKQYGSQLTLTGAEKINALFNYDESLLVHYGSKLAYDSNGAGLWTNYSGSYTPPSGAVSIRALEANKNFFFTTDAGVKKLDSLTGTVVAAGGFKALDGVATALATGTGFLSTANQVAYRIVWGIKDANNNLILGAPSQRIIAINTSGASQDVSVVFTIPSGITTSHFYQIYRSVMSGGSTVVPNDELGLVYENNPTALEITAKAITVTDVVTESLRGATLYTSPSQQGIAQSNDSPPLCRDMTFYKNSTFYGNAISKHRLILTMIAVGGTSGVTANDTITIGGVAYTAKASEDATVGEFKVTTGGTAAENIDATAQSLVRVINKYASNTLYYAYYLSGYTDLPGKILIEERSIGGSGYALISSRGSAYNPILPSSGTTVSTSNETSPHKIYISKTQQPEAVPLANVIEVGSANKEILRVMALRDSVFIFKEDGLFRLTGESISNFTVSLFDATVILRAPETAVAFNNQIFAYTSQGVVGISDSGSSILSRPIEVDLLPISTYANFSTISFGAAYDSDRKYILFLQSASTDTYPTQAYVYNSISNAWTRWVMSRSCGLVNPVSGDRLFLGSATSGYVYQERKTFTVADYADDQVSVTIAGSSGTTVTLSSTSGLLAGWTLIQGSRVSTISEVVDGTTLAMADSLAWTAGSATVYNPINAEIETVPLAAGNAGVLKHFYDLVAIFRRANFRQITLGVKSDFSNYLENTTIEPVSDAGWGAVPWGQGPWGGATADLQPIRTFVVRNKQRCHWLSVNVSHSVARDYFAIVGLSLLYSGNSKRMR